MLWFQVTLPGALLLKTKAVLTSVFEFPCNARTPATTAS